MRPLQYRPPRSRAGGFLAIGVLLGAAQLACSDADSTEVEEARARIEAEFGRRDDAGGESAAPEPDAVPGRTRAEEVEAGQGDGSSPPPTAPRSSEASAGHAAAEDPPLASTPAVELPDPVEPEPEHRPIGVDSLLALANSEHASRERMKAIFTQRIENPLLGRTREGRGRWHRAGGDRFRMDFDEPAGDVYVADGSCLWLYEPSLHDQVMVSSLEEGVELGTIDILGRLLSEARTRYDGVDEGTEVIDGVETRVVSLTPRALPARYVEVRLWIGTPDRYVRRFRIREENETVRTVTLTRLEPDAPIDPSVFEYAPPAGVPIFPDDVRCD